MMATAPLKKSKAPATQRLFPLFTVRPIYYLVVTLLHLHCVKEGPTTHNTGRGGAEGPTPLGFESY